MAEPEEMSTQGQRNQTQRRRLKPRSDVWKEDFTRYTKTEDGKHKEMARCNHCGKEYAYHGTRNMWKHLKEGCVSSQAQGSAGADVGAQQHPVPPPPPGAPSGSGALSMVEVELDQQPSLGQEDEPMQMMLGNQCMDMDMQAAPVYSAAVGVGAAPPAQQRQPSSLLLPPPCAPSRERPGESSGREEASQSQHMLLAPGRPCAQSQEPGLEEQAQHRPSLNEEEANRDLARMIALHGHDSSIVEDDCFRSFVRRLNPEFKLPTRKAIEEMCDGVFNQSRKNIRNLCCNRNDESLALGKVKTMETGEALYVTRHFIDNKWNLHRVVGDAYVLLPASQGKPCTCFTFQDYDVCTVLGVSVVTSEEAVGYAVEYVVNYLERKPFMVAGEITGDVGHLELKRGIEKRYESDDVEVLSTTYMDHVLHSIARCLLADADLAEDIFSNVEDVDLYLQWTRRRRQELLSKHGLDDPWEYNERWYWCYYLLMVVDYDPITSGTFMVPFNVWGEIYRAIKRISAPGTPTSALCLRELLKVRDVLQSQLLEASAAHEGLSNSSSEEEDEKKNNADVPLKKALETVDKEIEGSYLVWSIPHVFDPQYKLRYIESEFERAFGSNIANEFTSEVTRKIKELYNNYTIDEDSRAAAESELNNYLQASCAHPMEDFDILSWWKFHGSVRYPTVAKMARTALGMPACGKLTSDQIAHVRSIIR